MILLYILLAIVLLIVFAVNITVRLDIKINRELSVSLNFLFFKFKIFPSDNKKIKLKNFKIKNYRKKRIAKEKELLKKSNKKISPSPQKEKNSLNQTISYYIDFIKEVIFKAIKKFGKYLKIEIKSIKISVSDEDPAKTAISFGIIVQAVSYIKELIDNFMNVKYIGKNDHYICVIPDYISGKTTADIDLSLKIKIWQIFAAALTGLKGYIFDISDKNKYSKLKKNTK